MNKDEARNLLPWYAVGALDVDEARAVEAHLDGSSDLKQELAELRVLHATVGEVGAEEPAFRPELINDALTRIDAYEATRPVEQNEAGPSLWAWLRETLVGGLAASPAGARVALAAQFAVILALCGALFVPMMGDRADLGVEMTTLSGANDSPVAGAGAAISVYFEPTATEAQIRGLLADVGGQIVSGPTAQGAYAVTIGESDSAADDLEQLRSASIVRFANGIE